MPKIAVGVVAAAAAGYLIYSQMTGDGDEPEVVEETKQEEKQSTPKEIKVTKEQILEKIEPIIKELDMFGFLDSNLDHDALVKAIDEWIPKALKKYCGQ